MTKQLNNEVMPEEVEERKREVARVAYKHGLWSELACFNFMGCHLTPEQVLSWEAVMQVAVRAKQNGGIKEIWI